MKICANLDDMHCGQFDTSSPALFLGILLRLIIFFTVVTVLRLVCLCCGCNKRRRNIGGSDNAACDDQNEGNMDYPPPYPGPPTISQLLTPTLWTPETPPPEYKNVVTQDGSSSSCT